jgi:protein involved in polysaccharide export with SLBB domain
VTRKSLLIAAASLLSVVLLQTTVAQQLPSGVTPEQLRMFQSLPREERDALLQQLGIGGSGTGETSGSGDTRNAVTVTTPGSSSSRGFERNDRIYRVSGDETLLIDLVLPAEDEDSDASVAAAATGGVAARSQARPSASPAATPAPGIGDAGTGFGLPTSAPPRVPDRVTDRDLRSRLEDMRLRIVGSNPYQLDHDGVLRLPGFVPIPLNGLSRDDVRDRLALDPALRYFRVSVTLLHLKPTGPKALKPFGYETFRSAANAFVPGTDLPVPADYKIGSGDVMQVELYGQHARTYTLPVDREGSINIPDLGPVAVGGQSFAAVRSMLTSKVERQLIGTHARISLTDLRMTRVFVLGDSVNPGSYVVSSASTVTSALFASGGVKPIGSLRAIEVKRAGHLLRKLDLYDVLLRGDTSDDVRLETGDVVFVPPVGATVGIDGEVRRPAIYELGPAEHTVLDLVRMAGGATPEADVHSVSVERVGGEAERKVLTVDLGSAAGRDFTVRSGDVLRLSPVRPVVDNAVAVSGYVYRASSFEFHPGLRLSDVISSLDDVRPRADVHYVLIRREDPATRRITALSADLAAALHERGGPADVALAPRDRIDVFDLESNREPIITQLLDELRRQGRPDQLAGVVTVTGRVNVPGDYPHEVRMRVADLVRAGGGLRDSAYPNGAELTRYSIAPDGERRLAELRQLDLAAALRGDPAANVELQPYDVLTIKEMPDWRRVEQIELLGEVRFPGIYRVRRGETLRSVIDRAGGLTPLAFVEGAVFTREELKEKERQQIELLTARLKRDIAALSLEVSQTSITPGQPLAAGQTLLDELGHTKPVGRLVINLADIMKGRAKNDVTLRNGDRLIVPRTTEEVSVIGEVQNPTSHLYRPGLTRDDVIELSGGYAPRADRRHVFVIRADGSVGNTTSGWLHPSAVAMNPGDTVIVPFDAERMRPLPLWTSVTTIIYNLAVAAAAIGHL